MMLSDLGWNEQFAKEFTPFQKRGWKPARLIRDHKIAYGALYLTPEGDLVECEAVMCGKLYHQAETDAELPAVGDWVALETNGAHGENVIRARLPRQTCFSRKAAGHSTEEQVIAANVDAVIVVTNAGPDFNPRRMERYFTLITRSKAKPVVLLNKADLFTEEENEQAAATFRQLNPDAEIIITSCVTGRGIDQLQTHFQRGRTATLVGSSGVGKSTLVNLLLGEEWQWTNEVNAVTGKGRHTTTARSLLLLPSGGMLIDNPGMREVQMWTDETVLRERFADIEALAAQCQFHDCKHTTDIGCAIRAAVESGQLDPGRYQGFLKLDDEITELRRRRKKRQMTLERRHRRAYHTRERHRADQQEMQEW